MDNHLGLKAGDELALAFSVIPRSIISLDLSYNNLGLKTIHEMMMLFRAIPLNITSLDLSHNNLGSKTTDDLISLLRAIPSSVTFLTLTGNDLDSKNEVELAAIFRAIPDNVTTLYLDPNCLNRRSVTELEHLGRALPFVMRINDSEIESGKLAALQRFMGQGVRGVHDLLNEHLPLDLSFFSLTYLVNADDTEIMNLTTEVPSASVASDKRARQEGDSASDSEACEKRSRFV